MGIGFAPPVKSTVRVSSPPTVLVMMLPVKLLSGTVTVLVPLPLAPIMGVVIPKILPLVSVMVRTVPSEEIFKLSLLFAPSVITKLPESNAIVVETTAIVSPS